MTSEPAIPEPSNPLGIDGIEFIEYATAQPLALGALLEQMGFVATARHRSREVTLYRQGTMNVIVNAEPDALPRAGTEAQSTLLSAIALRVRDAGAAYRHAIDLGAWAIQTRAGAMELNIPGIHGVGTRFCISSTASRIFRFTTSTSSRLPTPRPARRRWRACISLAWCRRSTPVAHRNGSISTPS